MKIKITTDSAADVPNDLAKELNITVLPLTVTANGEEWADGIDISREEFYEILENSEKLPSSAAVTPALYTELFEQIWKEGYTDLVHISINSKGSSTYQNCNMARDWFYDEHPEAESSFKIHILDTMTYSMGCGMPAVVAARLVKAGEKIEKILEDTREWIKQGRTLLTSMNLKFLKNSGRVSPTVSFIGTVLDIKPLILMEDGAAKSVGKARGWQNAIREMVAFCKKEWYEGSPIAIGCGRNTEMMEFFINEMKNHLPSAELIHFRAGCAISINTGSDVLGMMYRKK